MTDKELHRLGRRELLQLLLEQGREAEKTRQVLTETEAELHQLQETYERLRKRLDHKDEQIHELNALLEAERTKREIELSESGSIAEAALRLNMIFEVAQKAADQYLYNIKQLHSGELQDREGELPKLPEMAELLAAEATRAETEKQPEQAVPEPEREPFITQRQAVSTKDSEIEEAEFEEEDFDEEENSKVIQLEHVKAEKIRRAEQEAEAAAQMVAAGEWEADSAAGTERIKEAVGIKISESGMRAITADLRPQETGAMDLAVEQPVLMEKQDTVEVESKQETDTQVAAPKPEQPVKGRAKRGTFFRQMGKLMGFKVK